jgi:hypothetical protein
LKASALNVGHLTESVEDDAVDGKRQNANTRPLATCAAKAVKAHTTGHTS